MCGKALAVRSNGEQNLMKRHRQGKRENLLTASAVFGHQLRETSGLQLVSWTNALLTHKGLQLKCICMLHSFSKRLAYAHVQVASSVTKRAASNPSSVEDLAGELRSWGAACRKDSDSLSQQVIVEALSSNFSGSENSEVDTTMFCKHLESYCKWAR